MESSESLLNRSYIVYLPTQDKMNPPVISTDHIAQLADVSPEITHKILNLHNQYTNRYGHDNEAEQHIINWFQQEYPDMTEDDIRRVVSRVLQVLETVLEEQGLVQMGDN